jgi:hypothetical protein
LCRFINADSVDVLDEDQNNVLENNLFAYCLNNPVNMVDYDGNSAVAIAGGYGLYVWAFAGANAWNIIGQVVLVGMAVVTIVLAIKTVYDKTSGKKLLKMVRRLPDTGLLKMVQREKLMTNIQDQDRGVKVKRKR